MNVIQQGIYARAVIKNSDYHNRPRKLDLRIRLSLIVTMELDFGKFLGKYVGPFGLFSIFLLAMESILDDSFFLPLQT